MEPQQPKGFNIESFRSIWSRRKWLAILFFAAPLSAAAVFAGFLPNIYRATATVVVEPNEMPENFVKPSVTGDPSAVMHVIGEQILSRQRLGEMVDRFSPYPAMAGAPREAIIAQMRRDIAITYKDVTPPGGPATTFAFTISYRTTSPGLAARVANALATSYIQENMRMRGERAGETTRFLEAQLKEAKTRQTQAERRMAEFRSRHGVAMSQTGEAGLAAMERVATQLRMSSDARHRVMERRDALARQLAASGDPSPDILGTRQATLRQELAELRSRYSDKYPDVQKVRDELAAIERRIAEGRNRRPGDVVAGDGTLKRLKQEFEAADAEARELQSETRYLRSIMPAYSRNPDPGLMQEWERLSRESREANEHLATMQTRYEEARLAENMERRDEGDQFRVVDQAIAPMAPAGPDRLKLLMVGLLASLVLAAVAVGVAEQLDGSFHSADDLRMFTAAPVLLSIPSIVTPGDIRARRAARYLAAAGAVAGLALIAAASYVAADGNEAVSRLLARGEPS